MSGRLRVCYVTHASNLTGASRSLLDMLAALPREKVEPVVLLRQRGPLEGKLYAMGVPYAHVPYLSATTSTKATRPAYLKRALSVVFQPGVDRFIRTGGFDLVHNNSLLVDAGMIAAHKAMIPYVCHTRELVKEGHGLDFLEETRMRGLMSDAAAMVYISEFVARKYRAWVKGGNSAVIFDGVDTRNYDGGHRRLFESGKTRLLLAGRFGPNKGQLDAIKATELLLRCGYDIELTLVGGVGVSSYHGECISYIQKHDLVPFVCVRDFTDDLRSLRAESDIALTCSSNEALGRVTIEGMMACCLVIGADAGATPELIRHGETGLLYECGSPESLADRIIWAMLNPDVANAVAANGHLWAMDSFNMAAYGEAMVELYCSVLMRRGGVLSL